MREFNSKLIFVALLVAARKVLDLCSFSKESKIGKDNNIITKIVSKNTINDTKNGLINNLDNIDIVGKTMTNKNEKYYKYHKNDI